MRIRIKNFLFGMFVLAGFIAWPLGLVVLSLGFEFEAATLALAWLPMLLVAFFIEKEL